LENEASQCIAGLALTGTNYARAINLSTERFGQKHKIVNAYMQNLVELPTFTQA